MAEAKRDCLETESERAHKAFRNLLNGAGCGSALLHLVKLATLATDSEIGSISFTSPSGMDVLAAYNFPSRYIQIDWDFDAAGYERDEFFSITDIERGTYIDELGFTICGQHLNSFARAPIAVEDALFTVALIVAHTRPVSFGWPTPKARQLMHGVATLAASLLSGIAAMARVQAQSAPGLDYVFELVRSNKHPAALFDPDRRCIACNDLFRRTIEGGVEPIGTLFNHLTLAPMLLESFSRGEEIGATSFDIFEEGPRGGSSCQRLAWADVNLQGRGEKFMMVMLIDANEDVRLKDGIEELATSLSPRKLEPTFDFLRDTLVERVAIRRRNSMAYLAVRTWRKAIKPYQVKALRAIKARPDADAINAIAEEMRKALGQVIGFGSFEAIVPMPGGHSGRERSFSVLIAESLSRSEGLPLIKALRFRPHKGSSHPKQNVRRPRLELVQALTGPVLVVDDVATSGQHLEEAVTLLRASARSVFAMAWIAGE